MKLQLCRLCVARCLDGLIYLEDEGITTLRNV